MEVKFIPVDYDYFDFEGKNYVRIVGRSEKGKKICVIDSYEPNFYVVLKKGSEKTAKIIKEKIEGIKIEKAGRESKVEKVEIVDKKYLGENVKALCVYVTNHKDAHDIASEIGDHKEIDFRREYDINIITKYIKEKNVEPFVWYDIKGEILSNTDFGGLVDLIDLDIVMKAEKIEKSKEQAEFTPDIISYDIETSNGELGKGEILSIGLYGKNFKKVLSWKKPEKNKEYLEIYKNEGEMLKGFIDNIKKRDPDVITGYFSDGFDLPYLKGISEKERIKLNLGIDNSEPKFSRGRIPSGRIAGIVHVDILRFIDSVFSQYLQSETLSLKEVSKELVGGIKGEFDFTKLDNMKAQDWNELFSYNLQDVKVTYDLFMKIWPDMLEFCKIVKEPLFEITRNRMSAHVGNYLIHNLDKYDEIIEKRPLSPEIGRRRNLGKYEGAFVFEPKPGLYSDLVMFDFTSMYASVIVSYNLSLSTHKGEGKFSKKSGFFPEMLGKIIEKRKLHKREYAKNPTGMLKARSNAYKLLANAAYGYQGFFGARYYCREAAAATARLAKENILRAIEKIKKEGHEIIYSDTDSIAFLRAGKSRREINKLLDELNSKMPGIMELDLEGFFSRGLFVSKRTTSEGAKKKYALLDDSGKPKIRGFETVRRDWCKLTRELQSKVIGSILNNGDEKEALKLLDNIVKKIKNRQVSLDELKIKTKIRRPINEYLSEGPHVVAAKKLEEKGVNVSPGMIIEYYIGEGKGKRVGDRVYLMDGKALYDIDYYLNNQVLPAVENIFEVFEIDIREYLAGEKQKKLF